MNLLFYFQQATIIRSVRLDCLEHLKVRSSLYTDESGIYYHADKLFAGHLSINHSKAYVKDGVHTNNIENVWKHVKKMIDGTYFHISLHHAKRYMSENTYRWNRREQTEREIFEDFFSLVSEKRISYKELKSIKENKLAA